VQSISIRSAFIFIVVIAIGFLTACGGGSSAPKQQGPPPVFGTNPVLTAAEGQTYTYKMRASDWAGAVVTFSLTQGPAGAKLDNDTITWVPTADQARKPNNFAVVATTALGGKASQAWTVEPTGIVHISWVDTYWDENGATAVPFDMSRVADWVEVYRRGDSSGRTFRTLMSEATTLSRGLWRRRTRALRSSISVSTDSRTLPDRWWMY
jgi:Putative Ig domain